MIDPVGARLFAALRDAATQQLGPDHDCTAALARAVADGAPSSVELAQDELRRLEPATLEELMGSAHKALREDPAAIMGQWRGPGRGARPN